MQEKEYAIWFEPSGNEFKSLIQNYSKQYKTPLFEPHITLLAGIKGDKNRIEEKVKILSQEISPFDVTINKISHSAYYYRCIILELTLTNELKKSHEIAKNIFGMTGNSPYLPHISIVYGDLNETARIIISAKLKQMLNKKTQVESLSLLHASTAMPPEDWRTVLRCNL